jgi:hypothetical protein
MALNLGQLPFMPPNFPYMMLPNNGILNEFPQSLLALSGKPKNNEEKSDSDSVHKMRFKGEN